MICINRLPTRIGIVLRLFVGQLQALLGVFGIPTSIWPYILGMVCWGKGFLLVCYLKHINRYLKMRLWGIGFMWWVSYRSSTSFASFAMRILLRGLKTSLNRVKVGDITLVLSSGLNVAFTLNTLLTYARSPEG